MKSIILCEGKTDMVLLSYYLSKSYGWDFIGKKEHKYKKQALSGNMTTISTKEGQKTAWYFNHKDDLLCIFSVGSESRFNEGLEEVLNIMNGSEYVFDKIVLFSDRDDKNSQSNLLSRIQKKFNDSSITFSGMNHKEWNESNPFEIFGDSYKLSLLPLIVPFEENGTLETTLLNAREKVDGLEATIVKSGNELVDSLKNVNGLTGRYLKGRGVIPKAKLGVYFSIVSPERTLDKNHEIIDSIPWENSEYLKETFKLLKDLSTCD